VSEDPNTAGWTFETLRVDILARLDALDRLMAVNLEAQKSAMAAALVASKDAIDKAEQNTAKWQASANEWRGAMTDREQSFMREDAFQRAHADLIQRLDTMNKTLVEKMETAVTSLQNEVAVLRDQVNEFSAVIR
jgi:hypothetical protein